MSRMNARWSPTPYPKGITHALLISRSPDIHIPSTGFDPWKNVAPGLAPMCCTIASLKSSPFLSPSSFLSGLLMMCLLWSIKRIIWSPDSHHFLICLVKSCQNRTRGQVRSFFFVIKYLRCCWYVVPELTIVFLHGLYAMIILV